MTAHTMVHAGRDSRYDAFAAANLSYRPQPGSPTLTNPDMILPDYDEPEHLDDRSHSPLVTWNNAHPPHDFHDFSQAGYVSGPLPPTTPIIYGNGTMLSDIGEVTEVESTVGHPSSRNSSGLSGTPCTSSGTPLRSSPTMGKRTLKKKHNIARRDRRLSIESTSTVHTIDSPEATFDDIDDSVSVDDSDFQGDDEESLASEFVDETSVQPPSAAIMPSGHGPNEHRLSTNSISKRAEQILANAKHRLLTMEGNLNRAMTFSYSSMSECSTPPPGAHPNGSIHDRPQTITPTHSRNVSENSLQGAARTATLPQRSASALGAAGGYRQHLTLSRSADGLGSKHSSSSLKSPLSSIGSALEPLDEDESPQDKDNCRSGSRAVALGSPTYGSPMEASVTTRSASAAQMRDLQDQMQGLKGKISSLKQQAQADSMKRRSLQSLRAPSPFTHARWDQDYTSPKQADTPEIGNDRIPEEIKKEETEAQLTGSAEAASSPHASHKDEETQSVDHHQVMRSADAAALNGEPNTTCHSHHERDEAHLPNDGVPEKDQEDQDQDEFADYASESGESLYHDTHQEPTDISHEDREDAFDYEHFFLHSAMGTLSRQRMARRDSVSSEGSQDSVETTRGPTMTHARRPSIDTLASVDSFATAMEGRESRSSVSRSTRTDDGFVTPTANYEDEDSPSATTTGSTFGGLSQDSPSCSGSGSGSGSDSTRYYRKHARYNSVIHRPVSANTSSTLHRPSVSSFESTGTNRSFPLVNKARLSQGALTPSGSPDSPLKQVAESLMNETRSICDKDSAGSGPQSPAIQTLSREDQVLVEQVVANLGRCVLGLSEATRLGTGNHAEYRERIEAASKLLESIGDRAPVSP
ncbi:hypothetical protein MAC_03187 [Metarhizium acridum CQMa 102]|uniref:Uncharacterized protein n=1 Tax=Metarhizium acridum (strain CQMa 102) TaxID=655827 RepID=E9DZY9_METAQ|nr:uncharacterized protein MAC_03187 [Metarhizium acridum CQMa 102]EFY90824.1 hypothetical protein MAC_03187 [Metarhizium acridum CQMa 102]